MRRLSLECFSPCWMKLIRIILETPVITFHFCHACNACKHAGTNTCTHARTHTSAHTQNGCTHMHIHMHAHMHKHIHIHTHMYLWTWFTMHIPAVMLYVIVMHARTYTLGMYTHKHVHMHTHINSYISYLHIPSFVFIKFLFFSIGLFVMLIYAKPRNMKMPFFLFSSLSLSFHTLKWQC